MDLPPGSRVRARGLIWDVRAVDRICDRDRFDLRCAEGDMAGLEWEIFVPPERIEPIGAAFDPRSPVPLAMWRLMHRAHMLNELPAATAFAAREPGRVRIEPYQLVPLMRALEMPRPRLLLADGVGLGKTVQACLIAVEMIARRRAHRILIVVPSGPLLVQWEEETRVRFGLRFTPLTSAAELWDVRRAHELGANPFGSVSLCLTALDFAKQDHVLEEIERSTWDLVIIDEAHHCAGFDTHRRRLAEVLAARADGLLLLTATPHDGHEAHFASLIALLDPSLVDGAGGFAGRAYRRHVIRRLKPHIRDPRTGAPLFRRRHVLPVKVDVEGPEHEPVRAFHRALTAFVVPRLRGGAHADDGLAFVSLLKRSVSTISACLGTLRVVTDRIAARDAGGKVAQAERARALRAWRRRAARFGVLSAADEAGQDALEIESMSEVLRVDPSDEPARLIALGQAAEMFDPKLRALLLEVRLIRVKDERANILIYTEYTDSQVAAARVLRLAIAGEVLTIGGRDSDAARATAAHRFGGGGGLVLISTDALAEGLNLHRHCCHLIHLDLPYNPNRLEQRNGRIDRYGQQREPHIRYLYIPGTFEERLLLHLITKYEKARASLDVMPDTLGFTVDPEDFGESLTGGLSEEPDDLFKDMIGMRAPAVEDSDPETVAALLRDIDRAYDNFDLMAVGHGWFGTHGLNAGMARLRRADALRRDTGHAEDLVAFTAAVIEAETGIPALERNELRLPPNWCAGLEGSPGFDPVRGAFCFTRDVESDSDSEGFLGRAHPLVRRAIRAGCQLPATVANARGAEPGLVLTYEMEIPVANRVMFRRVIAVLARPDQPPVEVSPLLSVREADFGPEWSDADHARAEAYAASVAAASYDDFSRQFAVTRDEEAARLERWLRAIADRLCGPFVPPTSDLFGAPAPGPAWRHREDPKARLIAFATDPGGSASGRREANEALEIFNAAGKALSSPDPMMIRPIGMLCLVPEHAA